MESVRDTASGNVCRLGRAHDPGLFFYKKMIEVAVRGQKALSSKYSRLVLFCKIKNQAESETQDFSFCLNEKTDGRRITIC